MLMQEWIRLRDEMHSKQDLTRLAQQYPQHSYDTLRAMHEQLFQRQVSRNYYLLRQHGHDFIRTYQCGDKSLIQIAHDYNLTPVMVARRVLQLIDPSLTSASTRKKIPDKRKITRMLRDPSTIVDEGLRLQVDACVQADDLFGPNVDRTHAVLGLEYEALLIQYIENLKFQFETENDLRRRSSYKTPDVLLRVPVAFHGHVVCWIDSKAKFADEYTLKKDYTDSLSSYVGRFGPGMVVYWFGFVSDCDCPMTQDDGVLLVDQFPNHQFIHTLPGTQLSPSSMHTRPWVIKPS